MVFYLCELCNFETEKKTDFNTHCSRKKHLKNVEKQKESNIKCNRCNFTFLNEEQLTNHKERNSLYFTNNMFKHRKCNDFTCILCNLQFTHAKLLKQHQTNCEGVSKFANNIKQKTIDKNKKKFESIKQHYIETGQTQATIKINNALQSIVKENQEEDYEEDEVYPEEDYYHDYDFIHEDEWDIQQPDPSSKFYNRFFEKETIKYKNKTYIIDRLFNCYNKNNEIIGGFIDI